MSGNIDIDPQLVETPNIQPNPVANPVLQAILSAIDPNLGSGTLPSIQDLISQLGSSDPTLGLIARYLISQQESVKDEDTGTVGPELEEEQHLTRKGSEQLVQIVERLERRIKKLHGELEQLRERSDTLALALGACYLCWGDNSDCPVCGGTGRPGSIPPDRRVFSRLIVPAIHALQAPKEVHRNNSNKHQVVPLNT